MALKLAEIGVDTIEAGFPKSSPDDFEAVSRIAKEVEGPYIAGLARCTKVDIEPAWAAIQHSKKPTLHVFTYMVNKEALDSYEKSPENITRESIEGVRLAKSREDLIKYVNMYLKDPSIDREGRKRMVVEQCYKFDGKSGERIANHVLNLLKEDSITIH